MVAEAFPVIGCENDDGVFQQPGFSQSIHNAAYLLIDHGDVGEVVGPLQLS